MLPVKAVEAPILELIRSLQCKPYLRDFYLVGGTALALSLNHRKSVDIDLFSNFEFDVASILDNLQQDYTYQISNISSNTLKGSISNIKVDIIAHRYPLIGEPHMLNGIRFLSFPDIIAMKLNAISISGQRSKDFIDICYLLEKYSLAQMVEFYQKKYNQGNTSFILKSLIYFKDVDLNDWPVMIADPLLKWPAIRKKIEKAVLDYSRK